MKHSHTVSSQNIMSKKSVLSQGQPRDAVNFDTYPCGFLTTARLSCRSLSAECSESSVKKV